MDYDRIVAVGLSSRNDAELFTASFDSLWRVDRTPRFGNLLRAIDEAERRLASGQQENTRRQARAMLA